MSEPVNTPHEAQYAVVEIFGHRRHVGRVSEAARFGGTFLRVDVPTEEAAADQDFATGFVTHFYGAAAIFGVTPTTLDAVWSANRGWRREPGLLPSPTEDADFAEVGGES